MGADVRKVRAMRLRAQGLIDDARPWGNAADVAHGMLAMQAQDAKGVLWAVSTRAAGQPDEATVSQAFVDGELVRNRPSRGTLQVTDRRDMGWLSALLSKRSNAAALKRRDQIGVTEDMVHAVSGVIAAELGGGAVHTRSELVDACSRAGCELDGTQAGHILRHLTERMEVVFHGAPGRVDSFAAGRPVVDSGVDLRGDEALAELAVRYFGGRGPATAQCLSWWANLTMGDARRAIDAAGAALEAVSIAGAEFVVPTGGAELVDDEVESALSEPLLLAPFDEYLLGYRSREAVITPERLDAVVPGRNGMFKPIVVVDGEVVGIWSRKATKRAVTVTVEPFADLDTDARDRLDGARGGLQRRAQDYGDFLGLEPELIVAATTN